MRYTNPTAARMELFVSVLVLLLATNIGLVNLDLADHRIADSRSVQPSLSNALRQIPSGFLCAPNSRANWQLDTDFLAITMR